MANNCTDGGRARPDEGGIGGTGLRPVAPDDDDSGVGGTGISAASDTGIIGTVTGFASICVGGLEIHYSAETPVQVDDQPVPPARLAVGQVVEVVATGSGSELSARQIAVRHIVSGPVTRVDTEHNEIEVIGQTVQLSPITRASGADQEYAAVAAAYPLHAFVQVSGMRRGDGVVVASRVVRSDASEMVQLAGPITQSDASALTIAGTRINFESTAPPGVGAEVRVVGRWDGSAVIAQSVDSLSRIPFDGRVARVDIEGFARQTAAAQIQVGAFSVEVPSGAQGLTQLAVPGARLRIQAIVQDQHVIVQRVGVLDELPSLPPLPQKSLPGWNGGKPGDGKPNDWRDTVGAPPAGESERGEQGEAHEGPAMKPEGSGGMSGAPPELSDHGPAPQLPDRPPAAQIPDRPAVPHIPDRPAAPQIPDRPAPPQLPERPARPERPSLPLRPDGRGRL